MTRIGRYAKARAKAGRGDALAERLLEVARDLRGTPGCELYVVNRVPGDPDTIWVTEIWSGQEQLDAAVPQAGDPRIGQVLELLDGPIERVDTTPVGGAGLADAEDGAPPYTLVALDSVKDAAAAYGYGELGSARFAAPALETRATGISLQRLHPGRRQAFGHRHRRAEEVYVVLAGSGRARLDEQVVELTAGDALRVRPSVKRAFEAGPDGLELLAVGPRVAGDSEVLMGWWGDGAS